MGQIISLSQGVATKIHELDNGFAIETLQDVSPFLDFAHEMRTEGNVGSSEFRYAATIPDVVQLQYCNEKGISYQEFLGNPVHVQNLLNDPKYARLRIWEGRV